MSLRSFAKWILIALILIAALVAALYAATPAIVSKLSPIVAERFGLINLEIDIDHPRWRGVNVRRVSLDTEQLTLRGESARATYSWRELVDGRLASLVFAQLDIAVSSRTETTPSVEGGALDPVLFTPPVGYLGAERLRIEFPDTGFVGVGRAALGNGVLSFVIDGIAPETASRLALSAELNSDGVFNARFSERGDASLEYLRVDGALGDTAVKLSGQVSLKGFALQLVSEILGIGPGSGSVAASFETTLPWPLPESGEWPPIDADIPMFEVDWQSAKKDLRLNKVSGSAVISGRGANGSVSGTIAMDWPERSATIDIPKPYRFTYAGGTLSGPGGLRVRLKDTSSDTRATIRSFSFVTGTTPLLEVDTDLVSSVNAVSIEGRAGGRLTLNRKEPLGISGRFEFNGDIAVADQRRKGSVSSSFTVDDDDLSADGTMSSGIFAKVPFSLLQNLDTGAGAFSAKKLLVFDNAFAASIFPDWPETHDLDSGRIDASLKLDWKTPDKIAAELRLTLDKVRAHYNKNTAKNIDTVLMLRSADALNVAAWRLEPSRITVQGIDAGLTLTNVQVGVSGTAGGLGISDLQADVLGGRAYSGAFDYDIDAGSADFSLMLEDIDLAEVLALEGDDIVGTGRLDGELPVSIRNAKPSVQAGRIEARPPGGTIRLTPSFAGPSGQPGLDFALLALKDFRYSELMAGVNYAENGDLELAVRLMGRNPEIENGRAILYNLNISENIPVLLESLHLQDRLSEKIEERVR